MPLPKSSAVVVRGKLMDGMLREEKMSGDFHIENTRDTYGIQDDYWEFVLHNDTDQEITYGASDIFLNVMVDGQWYLVPQHMVTMMSYQVLPKSSTSIQLVENMEIGMRMILSQAIIGLCSLRIWRMGSERI